MSILIENVSKKFGTTYALKNVNLEIGSGSLTALVGPSGSGKSTLLRIIAGFENPEKGRVWLFGNDATKQTIENREIGFVFQNYALFPNLTVWENIAFGLKIKKVSYKNITERVKELLELIQLENFSHSYPYQLSGGQRQRVALARAMAVEPKLLLLDEPFGALDPKVRKDLRNWLKELHSQVPLTTLLVTHDQQEAMEVADQLVVFNNGQVAQFGTPKEIYDSPANDFIMNFIGQSNKISQSDSENPIFSKNKLESLKTENIYYTRPHGYSFTENISNLRDQEFAKLCLIPAMDKLVSDEGSKQVWGQNESSNYQLISKQFSEKNNFVNKIEVKIKKIIYGESLVKLELIFLKRNELFKYQISRKAFEKLIHENVGLNEKDSIDTMINKFSKKEFLLFKKE